MEDLLIKDAPVTSDLEGDTLIVNELIKQRKEELKLED